MPSVRVATHEFVRFITIIAVIFYITTSSEGDLASSFSTPDATAADRAQRLRLAYDVLGSSHWGDMQPNVGKYLNLTGFRDRDHYSWHMLAAWQNILESPQTQFGKDPSEVPGTPDAFFHNVTGTVKGTWSRHSTGEQGTSTSKAMNLSAITPGLEWQYTEGQSWARNITGNEGSLTMRLEEKQTGEQDHTHFSKFGDAMRTISATIIIEDETTIGNGWAMKLHGIHWVEKGRILLTTTSEKFAGIFGLPHVTLQEEDFLDSQALLNMSMENTLKKPTSLPAYGELPWASTTSPSGDVSSRPAPHCEYLVYAQVQPSLGISTLVSHHGRSSPLEDIEQELRFPDGAFLPPVPVLRISTAIFSPDCGFILESKGPPKWSAHDGDHLVGQKIEVFLDRSRHWLLVLMLALFGQAYSWKLQYEESSTPSTMSKVSLRSLGILLMGDGLVFISLAIVGASETNLFPSALLAAFASLMSLATGAKFVGAIHKIQEPERRQAEARRAASPGLRSATTVITAAGADTSQQADNAPLLPLQDTPIIIPSDQDLDADNDSSELPQTTPSPNTTTTNPRSRSDFATLYGQFVLVLTLILFISLASFSWPQLLRKIYFYAISTIYLSFWLPQILRNVQRNCRQALTWEFVVGQSLLRLVPFAYLLLKEDNMLSITPNPNGLFILAGWVWLQLCLLLVQRVLGPRYGIPASWTTDGWDYHPVLREDEMEAGNMPLGLLPSSPVLQRRMSGFSDAATKDGMRSLDCAICMQLLEVPLVANGDGHRMVGVLARRAYMVTPCRHIFHTPCLEGWLKYRLQCPICRETLPAL